MGVAAEAGLVEKVCMRGLERLMMEGWGVGRWVVVRPREDWLWLVSISSV